MPYNTRVGLERPERPLRERDYGFFGPDSPSWKVWTAPTALLGFQRAVVLEHFDPFLTAAVADREGIFRDPGGRLDATLAYFLTVAVGDSQTVIEASRRLVKVHAEATGTEPITGRHYNANNPAAQLWIHLTGWHSVLKCYEKYGPGLSVEEERRFWAECRIAAELQTCKPEDVPDSRAGVREYFAQVRPQLCSSERARRAMRYLLYTPRSKGGVRLWAGSRLLAPAVIATLPRWMRETGGFDQFRLLDWGYTLPARIAVRVAARPAITLGVLKRVAPRTAGIMEAHLKSGEPEYRGVVTPAQAAERRESALERPSA